jgi:hypothetical protein
VREIAEEGRGVGTLDYRRGVMFSVQLPDGIVCHVPVLDMALRIAKQHGGIVRREDIRPLSKRFYQKATFRVPGPYRDAMNKIIRGVVELS